MTVIVLLQSQTALVETEHLSVSCLKLLSFTGRPKLRRLTAPAR